MSGLALSVGRELDEWVDEMLGEFWQLEDVCIVQLLCCQWTMSLSGLSVVRRHTGVALSSDPKSELGPVQPNGQ